MRELEETFSGAVSLTSINTRPLSSRRIMPLAGGSSRASKNAAADEKAGSKQDPQHSKGAAGKAVAGLERQVNNVRRRCEKLV